MQKLLLSSQAIFFSFSSFHIPEGWNINSCTFVLHILSLSAYICTSHLTIFSLKRRSREKNASGGDAFQLHLPPSDYVHYEHEIFKRKMEAKLKVDKKNGEKINCQQSKWNERKVFLPPPRLVDIAKWFSIASSSFLRRDEEKICCAEKKKLCLLLLSCFCRKLWCLLGDC